MRLAIFDFDGTLIAGNSWHEYFRHELGRRPVRAPLLSAGWLARRLGWWTGARLRAFALAGLTGRTRDEVTGIGRTLWKERLERLVRPDAIAEVERYRNAGYTLVLATGAWDFVVMPMAELGQFEHVVATPVEYAGELCTGRIVGNECLGATKRDRVCEAFAKYDVRWDVSSFWTDHVSDGPLLELVGERWFVSDEPIERGGLPAGTRVVRWSAPG